MPSDPTDLPIFATYVMSCEIFSSTSIFLTALALQQLILTSPTAATCHHPQPIKHKQPSKCIQRSKICRPPFINQRVPFPNVSLSLISDPLSTVTFLSHSFTPFKNFQSNGQLFSIIVQVSLHTHTLNNNYSNASLYLKIVNFNDINLSHLIPRKSVTI